MANKSSKSFTGEDRDENPHIREQEVLKSDIVENSGPAQPAAEGVRQQARQENLQNRGLQEDQPQNPIRTTGSTRSDQEVLPTGEPDPGEI